MRITCPGCASTYDVPDARLKPGRPVRCARCGSRWRPETDTQKAAPPPAYPDMPSAYQPHEVTMAPPEITAMDRLAAASPPPPRPAGLIAAWIMTGIVLALTATIVIGWRDTIVRVWPPSTRILGVTAHTGPHEARTEAKKAE